TIIHCYTMQRSVTKPRSRGRTVYPISLGEEELESLEQISEKTGASKAEAIREAIKSYAEEVKGLEVVKLRTVSKEKATKEILEYLEKNDRAWTSDIADSLNLNILFVNEILEELWRKNKIEQHTATTKSN
ncbi:MAG: ribbon-helix-helix protein, CopG family, partial [Nitrososphaerales archaeon]